MSAFFNSRLVGDHNYQKSIVCIFSADPEYLLMKFEIFAFINVAFVNIYYAVAINEKKYCKEGLINGGIYLINRNIIESWNISGAFSLEKDIMEKEAGTSLLKGMVFGDVFIDIGIPEDYRKAQTILRSV